MFYSIIYSTFKNHVPTYKKYSSSFPTWFSKELKLLINTKKKAHLHFKQTNLNNDYLQFSNIRNQCKTIRKRDYNNYLLNVQNSITHNPKYFWKYFNNKKPNHLLPNLMSYNNEAEDGQSIVDIFGKYFSSVYTQPIPILSLGPNYINTLNSICTCEISVMDIFNELDNINLKLCSGPDNLNIYLGVDLFYHIQYTSYSINP